MADADDVVARMKTRDGVRYTGLWLNEQGLRRALASGRLEVKGRVVLCASAAFLKRNTNMTPEDNRESIRKTIRICQENGVTIDHGGIQAAFGCNFEGEISTQRVLDVTADCLAIARAHGITLKTFALADTMAWATPASIRRVVGALRDRHPELELILHLHDTRGMGVANVFAGLQMGVRNFDAAVAGLGGCPFAGHKGAAGNVCTEDVVFMCDEMGIETGIDLEALIEAARLAEDIVGHPLPGSVMKGGSLARLRNALSAN
jgi:hydroxymethylglutaryl-CoA lyase